MGAYEELKARTASRTDYPDEKMHRRFQAILGEISPGARVLDVACGSGTLIAALRERGCVVRGIDLAPGAVALARAKGLDVMGGDVDSYESSPDIRSLLLDTYDAIILSKCLVYLKCKNNLLPQLRAKSIYVVQSNPAHWKFLCRRWVLRDSAHLEDKLPYVTAEGNIINSHSLNGLSRWAASYGYKSRILTGKWIRGRDRVTVLERP